MASQNTGLPTRQLCLRTLPWKPSIRSSGGAQGRSSSRTSHSTGSLLRRGRLIVKEPIAALSSDWLARRFDFEVDVLVRHPAAFAASLKRFNWRHPFGHFLTQEMLMERYLDPYRVELESKPENIAEQAAIIWKCIYGVLFAYVDSNAN